MIFITGANGFVGLHLQKYFNKKNIPFIAGTRSLYGDMSQQNNWEQLLDDCNAIVHLAARVHVMDETASDPLAMFRKYNVETTLNLAKAAKKKGIKRFIFISSIKVNGEETFQQPFRTDDKSNPQDFYGISKMEAEKELLKLHEKDKFEVVIIRPPLIYGAGVKANFESLMKLSQKGLPLPFGLVSNKRSLVSIFNLVDLINVCLTHPNAGGKTFLISDDKDLSLKEMIEKMAAVKGHKAILLPIPVSLMKLGAVFVGKKHYAKRLFGNLQVDTSETKKILNWNPPFTFEQTFQDQ